MRRVRARFAEIYRRSTAYHRKIEIQTCSNIALQSDYKIRDTMRYSTSFALTDMIILL